MSRNRVQFSGEISIKWVPVYMYSKLLILITCQKVHYKVHWTFKVSVDKFVNQSIIWLAGLRSFVIKYQMWYPCMYLRISQMIVSQNVQFKHPPPWNSQTPRQHHGQIWNWVLFHIRTIYNLLQPLASVVLKRLTTHQRMLV